MDALIIGIGFLIAPTINYAIYQFAFFSRPISPWQRADATATSRIPVIGWLFRKRDREELGKWFWFRPLLIELLYPLFLWMLYRHGTDTGFVSPGIEKPSDFELYTILGCIGILSWFLAVATFIDFDEWTIPDLVTVPGTLIAIVASVVFPGWRLPELDPTSMQGQSFLSRPIHANSPFSWPLEWTSHGSWGLGLAVFIWCGWCFAMLDRKWITRRGWKKAWKYFLAGLTRSRQTVEIGIVGTLGLIWIVAIHTLGDQARWESLLSTLYGIGLGGMLVWSFRLVSAWVLRKEALGFGDVTLMAMVGAFVGWQVVWIAFFLSPFVAMLFIVLRYVVVRDTSTPFGPFLSMAVLYVLWDWSAVWGIVSQFILPPLMLILFWGILLVALAAMLTLIEFVKMLLFRTKSKVVPKGS